MPLSPRRPQAMAPPLSFRAATSTGELSASVAQVSPAPHKTTVLPGSVVSASHLWVVPQGAHPLAELLTQTLANAERE